MAAQTQGRDSVTTQTTDVEHQQRQRFAEVWRNFQRTEPNSADRVRLHLYAPYLRGRVLDVGAGDGMLAKFCRGRCSVVSCDVTVEALRGLEDGAIAASAMNLPFRDSSFDCVVATELLEHVENDGRALEEMHRVLRDGGTLIVSVPLFPLALPEVLYILLTKHCLPLPRTLKRWDPTHERRYRRSTLLLKHAKASLSIVSTHDTAGPAFTFGYYFVDKILRKVGIASHAATRMAQIDRLLPIGPSSNILVISNPAPRKKASVSQVSGHGIADL